MYISRIYINNVYNIYIYIYLFVSVQVVKSSSVPLIEGQKAIVLLVKLKGGKLAVNWDTAKKLSN